jgi:serine/threonine protein kinase
MWIIMERATMSLGDFLRSLGPGGLEFSTLTSIVSCVMLALDHIHNCKDAEGRSIAAIHHNLRPENVLVFSAAASGGPVEPAFKISGFGSSLRVSALDTGRTYVRTCACSPSFLFPSFPPQFDGGRGLQVVCSPPPPSDSGSIEICGRL